VWLSKSRRFGGTYRLHLHVEDTSNSRSSQRGCTSRRTWKRIPVWRWVRTPPHPYSGYSWATLFQQKINT
jgi:hypothetical protein